MNAQGDESIVLEPIGDKKDERQQESAIEDAGEQIISEKPLSFYLGFLALNINVLIISMDATTLAIALPSIAEHLNGAALESFWANIAYLLCVVITQPLYTTISDIFGRKPPLYFAYLLFILGSITFAVAQNMMTIIAGRVLQGLGGGGLDLLSEIIVADITTLRERPLYLGLMAIPIALGTILGPIVGALFSTYLTWRWIGWINLPLLGVGLPMVFFFLRTRPIETDLLHSLKSLDWGGMFLSVGGITIFVVPLSWAGALYPWASWHTLLPLLIGFALLVVLGFYEAIPQFPVIPHRLFHSHSAKWTLLGNFIQGAMLFTILQYLPLLFQAVYLEDSIQASLSLLPSVVVCVVAAAGGVIIVGAIGKGYVWITRMFWAIMILGTGLLSLLGLGSSRSMRMGIPTLWSAGVGSLLRLLHLAMQASVQNADDTGHAIGLLQTFRLLGGLIGLAIGSTVFNSLFAAAMADVSRIPGSLAFLRDGREAIGFIPHLGALGLASEDLNPILEAYLTAMKAVFYVITGFGTVGFISSLFTREHSIKSSELGRQRFEES